MHESLIESMKWVANVRSEACAIRQIRNYCMTPQIDKIKHWMSVHLVFRALTTKVGVVNSFRVD